MQIYESASSKVLKLPDQSLGPGLRVPRRQRDLERTESGCLIMNERNLRLICEVDGLYEYPEMNSKLYLHYKVIEEIRGLQKYVNLKTIYLQNNVITKICNLDCLTQLQNLFLQNNMIKKMEGMQKLKDLRVLNLSNNNIFVIEGISQLAQLQNLTLSKNYLTDFSSLEHLGQCSETLTAIDLTDNQIVADVRFFDLVRQVKCLYLFGNPLVREVLHYRRTLVGKLKNLMYLDQRAVDQEERLLAESWELEGEAGFKKARESIHALRRQRKQEARDEIMQTIDVHRRKKINVFEGNILEFQKQIEKLRGYLSDHSNADQFYFYETRIAEFMQKIRENQQFIDGIYKRMGIEPPPPVYTLELPQQVPEAEEPQEGMFQIRQEDEAASQGHSENCSHESSNNTESNHSSQLPSESSSSQVDSLKTYYSGMDELD